MPTAVIASDCESIKLRCLSLSDREFFELARVIEGNIGIKMPVTKKPMVASRLLRRLTQLNMESYGDYCQYMQSAEGWQTEEPHFLDLVTTHKTQFFREPEHFGYLVQAALPRLLASRTGSKTISAWSAACSTGEEVYTLAMVLQSRSSSMLTERFDFSICGTDISEFALRTARSAIYPMSSVSDIPVHLRSEFLLR